MRPLQTIEARRQQLQAELDAAKSQTERNRLGQFATPPHVAVDMLTQAQRYLPPDRPVRFLDPAFGTGAFYSALLQVFPAAQIEAACAYEIDPHYGRPAQQLWQDWPLDLHLADFTTVPPPAQDHERFSLIICNPPYVRHHHLAAPEKKRLQQAVLQHTGTQLNGLAGLYAYFVGIAHAWLREGGLAGWLIPSEFMDVNYGRAIRRYLSHEVKLLHIHRFDPQQVQFNDALVSSTVVWLRKEHPSSNHTAHFSFGGTLDRSDQYRQMPVSALKETNKWTSLAVESIYAPSGRNPVRFQHLFDIKRGVATGANDFFILNEEQIAQHQLPRECLTPILPSPRYLKSDEIMARADGTPDLERRLFLIDCSDPEELVQEEHPLLWRYLESGKRQNIHRRYLCRHRSIWYAQDRRGPAPFICTYMGRSNALGRSPFRFILNHSQAITPNVYLNLYPKPLLQTQLDNVPDLYQLVWQALRQIQPEQLMAEGRVYGGGLYKLEPSELGNLPVDRVFDPTSPVMQALPHIQLPLF